MSDPEELRLYREDESISRKRNRVLEECRFHEIPQELAELLADNNRFIDSLMPEGMSNLLRDCLREILAEKVNTLIYAIASTPKGGRCDGTMRLLYDDLLEAIDEMEDEG